MTNIESLSEIGILGDIRKRLGAVDENDTSVDSRIEQMTADELVRSWCGWKLGSGSWWVTMKSYYDQLVENKKIKP